MQQNTMKTVLKMYICRQIYRHSIYNTIIHFIRNVYQKSNISSLLSRYAAVLFLNSGIQKASQTRTYLFELWRQNLRKIVIFYWKGRFNINIFLVTVLKYIKMYNIHRVVGRNNLNTVMMQNILKRETCLKEQGGLNHHGILS